MCKVSQGSWMGKPSAWGRTSERPPGGSHSSLYSVSQSLEERIDEIIVLLFPLRALSALGI